MATFNQVSKAVIKQTQINTTARGGFAVTKHQATYHTHLSPTVKPNLPTKTVSIMPVTIIKQPTKPITKFNILRTTNNGIRSK